MSILKRTLMLSLAFIMLSFFVFSPSVNASGEYIPVIGSNGNTVKYRGTNIEVMMPASYELPERDFRAVWVTPYTNDISTFTSEEQYKAEINSVFETMEYFNMNAMIYHVRIKNDALYQSSMNPWSEYYSTNPSWDALPWIIEEAHKRGIEFHAWFNPYRIEASGYSGSLEDMAAKYQSNNIASNPEYLLKNSNGSVILNPGEPDVRRFLIDTVMEVVRNYDIDGVHFDDYFYISGVDDSQTYNKYRGTFNNLEDWRRAQVDYFIKDLSDAMTTYNMVNKKAVQLGISPSGIWRNGDGKVTYDDNGNAITNGSNTSGFAHYGNYLYSDTKKWIDEEWIDYILPQSYWAFDQPVAGFADVMDWWAKVVKYKDVNLYSGIGLYMANSSNNYSWSSNPLEAERQLTYLSKHPEVKGIAIFSYQHLKAAKGGSNAFSTVKSKNWYQASLLPEIKTIRAINPGIIEDLNVSTTSAGYRLDWKVANDANKYAIYRSEGELTYEIEQLVDVVGDIGDNGIVSFIDSTSETDKNYNYGIKAMSRTNTLSEPLSVSTENANEGELLPVGNIDNIIVSDNTFKYEDIIITWKPLTPVLGGPVTYEVYTSLDGINWIKNNQQISRYNNNLIQKISIGNFDKLYVKIESSNTVSFSESNPIEIKILEKYGKINGFTYLGDLFTNEKITFQWNKIPNNIDLEYKLQYSKDQSLWYDVISEENPIRFENNHYRQDYQFPNTNTNYYYRVVAFDEFGKSFSESIKLDTYEYLGDFVNLKVNGQEINGPIFATEEDLLNITWDVHDEENITYMTYVSLNLKNWQYIRIYDRSTSLSIADGKATQTFEMGFMYYKFYVYVEASTLNGISYSEVFEVVVTPLSHYLEDLLYYMGTEQQAHINSLDVFN